MVKAAQYQQLQMVGMSPIYTTIDLTDASSLPGHDMLVHTLEDSGIVTFETESITDMLCSNL